MVVELIMAHGTSLWIDGVRPQGRWSYRTKNTVSEVEGKVRHSNAMLIDSRANGHPIQIEGENVELIAIEGEASETDPKSFSIWQSRFIPERMVVMTNQSIFQGEVQEAIWRSETDPEHTVKLQDGTKHRLSEIELFIKATVSRA